MNVLAAALASLGVLSQASQAQSQAWKPVPGHIMTKWAADVSPDKVWPEYPRPQMVREQWQNLNGLWDYTLAGPKSAETKGRILVPFPIESALSGVGRAVTPDMTLSYARQFTIPEGWTGQRVLLHFGAVDWKATVSVNGRQVGTHTGGYDPFFFDITDALKPGDSNTLTVEVTDPTDQSAHPIGKQRLKPESIWYTATTGIWQTVWLEPVPKDSIRSLLWTTSCIKDGEACGKLEIELNSPAKDIEFAAAVFDGDKEISRATSKCDSCEAKASLDLRLLRDQGRELKLWSPDAPFLYTVKATISRNGKVIDQVTGYAALRELKVAKDDAGINRLMLNGTPTFQFGPLDQGFWPDGLYTPSTDEAMKEDILAVKKMGGNMLRKHVKVECSRFYYWCDTLGVLVWQDMPSPFPPKDSAAADWKQNFEDELRRMMDALRVHPCIVMWVPFNEGWGQHDTADIVAKVKKWDPSRLVNNASGWTDAKVGDVSDIHVYPGPGGPPTEASRACVLGEFGGLGLPLEGHTWVQKNNWGYVSFKDQKELTDAYVALIDKIPALIAQGLCAAVYTQTTDVEIECNGWMTYDRAVWKIDPERASAAAKKLYEPPARFVVVVPCAQQGRPVTWRYSLTKPADTWPGGVDARYDDPAWKEGQGGFGSEGTPGAIIGTPWTTSDIWLHLGANLGNSPIQNPYLLIHHDEDAEVYINGVLAAKLTGYTTGYTLEPISPAARKVMKAGEMIPPQQIMVHCHQTKGGQYIDVGIVDLRTQPDPPPRPPGGKKLP
jgi:hypothetical protein